MAHSFLFGATALLFLSPLALAGDDTPDFEQRLEWLCERLERDRKDQKIAGMSLAIVKDDRMVLARGFGQRDVENDLPATENTMYAIGSTTKAFTSMLIAMLADEGRMSFDDPVGKHVPGFAVPSLDTELTLRDALSHRTGITRMSLLWYGNNASREEILGRVRHAELWGEFRNSFLYNNVMYLAAGQASAAAAGMDWDTLLRERILDPLGMETANSAYADAQEYELAKGYAWDAESEKQVYTPMRALDNCAPAGSINSNVVEMSSWLRFLLAKGEFEGERLVTEAQFDDMWGVENAVGPGVNYGLGWMLRTWQDQKVVEHGGNIDGFAAAVCLYPESNLGFVLLMNIGSSALQGACVTIVADTLLGDWRPPTNAAADASDGVIVPGPALPVEEMQPYVGRYKFDALGDWVTIGLVDERLTLKIPGQIDGALEFPDSEGRWLHAATGVSVKFSEPRGNWVDRLELFAPGQHHRLPRENVEPDLPMTGDDLMDLRDETSGAGAAMDLGTLRLDGKFHIPHSGLEGTATWTVDGQERMHLLYDLGEFGHFRYVVDDDRAWAHSVIGGGVHLEGEAWEALLFQNPLVLAGDWRDYCDEVVVERTEMVSGSMAIVVNLKSFEGANYTLSLDPESGRVVQESGLSSLLALGVGLPTRYEDYRDVGGVMLPFRMVGRSQGTGEIRIQFDAATLDVDVDDALFTPPESDEDEDGDS